MVVHNLKMALFWLNIVKLAILLEIVDGVMVVQGAPRNGPLATTRQHGEDVAK
jgi:hypothetical protein